MVLTNQQILKSISTIEATNQKIIISYAQSLDKTSQNDGIIEIQITTSENYEDTKENIVDVSNTQENENDLVDVIGYLDVPDITDDEEDNKSKVNIEEYQPKLTNKKPDKSKIDQLLPDHLKSRTPNGKYDKQIREYANLSCTICQENHISFKNLTQHYEIMHHIKGYAICCDKKFYRKDRLMNHIINHIDPDAFKYDLIINRRSYQMRKFLFYFHNFRCPECGYISKDKVLLRIHLKGHLPPDQREFECDKCQQR